jgi:hypothetical protein
VIGDAGTNSVRLRRVTDDVRSATIGCRSAFFEIRIVTGPETISGLVRKEQLDCDRQAY